MPKIAVLFGIVLIGLGLGSYLAAPVEHRSPTAFIPALAGFLLIDCGILALKPNLRKHAMHAAAMIGLLGFLAPLIPIIIKLIDRSLKNGLALWSQIAMSVLCLAFLILCVRSFIAARKARGAVDAQPS